MTKIYFESETGLHYWIGGMTSMQK